jgi:diguanylate cyclase
MFGGWDVSPRGRARVVLWTCCGTVGCILIALWFDSFNMGELTAAQRMRAILTDVIVPAVLAGPLLYFFSNKLRELAIAHHQLAIFASTDSLTQVLNRGAFTTLVDAYLAEVRQTAAGGALLVVDVDHFKLVNDTLGHDLGDEALRLVAQSIKSALRSVDLVGRLGGEEFGVFLPGASPLKAEVVAERIRMAVGELVFSPDGIRRPLSVSVGGASFAANASFAEIYREADQRLYEAKDGGRNRVALSTVEPA